MSTCRLLRAGASAAALSVAVIFTRDARANDAPAVPRISLADAVAQARTQGFDVLLSSANVHGAEADVRVAGQPPNPALTAGPSRRVDCLSANCPDKWGVSATLS